MAEMQSPFQVKPALVKPKRRTRELQRGRVSIPGARYFLTIRFRGLSPPSSTNETMGRFYQLVRLKAAELTAGNDWRALCGILMPDHLHLLVTLGGCLTISQCVAKFKTSILRKLSTAAFPPFAWQDNFFEHRLRAEEASESYARYIFLNPYRGNLLTRQETWPWWWSAVEHRWAFETHLEAGQFPPTEWLLDTAQSNPPATSLGDS